MTVLTSKSPTARITPEEMLTLENEGVFELVDGKLVEKSMSYLSNKTAGLVAYALQQHVLSSRSGDVVPEQSFQCFPDHPERIRRPDIAFIAAERAKSVSDEGHVTIAPDIAIEVVSPSDKIYELDEKLADYRSAGVKLVWVVNPNSRTIRVHRPDHTVSELVEQDRITGESVLPGFSAQISDLLPAKLQ